MMQNYKGTPLLAVTAESGTGKTTLLTKIIPILKSIGINLGCVKHTHHQLALDTPGKDSHRLRMAGVDQMLLGDSENWALFGKANGLENKLENLLKRLNYEELDLILIEGFRSAEVPSIILRRSISGTQEPFIELNKSTIAIAGKKGQDPNYDLPYLNLDDPIEIADFIVTHVLKHSSED